MSSEVSVKLEELNQGSRSYLEKSFEWIEGSSSSTSSEKLDELIEGSNSGSEKPEELTRGSNDSTSVSDSSPTVTGSITAVSGSIPITDDATESALSGVKSSVQVITRYMCKFCGLQFIHRPDMDAHAALHDEEKPPLTCGVCGKSYNTRSKLQRHVRVHSGERPFPCTLCGKRFPRSDHVRQHMKVHLKKGFNSGADAEGAKNYCRLCGVKFEYRRELNEHLLTHGYSKFFSCMVCGEVFETNELLKVHRLSHVFEDFTRPVLTVPTPTPSTSSTNSGTTRSRKRKRKSASSSAKKNKDKLKINLGFAKFKLSRQSGSEIWETVNPALKSEEKSASSKVENKDTMPILERILTQTENAWLNSVNECEEGNKEEEEENNEEQEENNEEEDRDLDTPQMAISACYSLAEGQDNSDIPDIEEIRASTLTDGGNMIVIASSSDDAEHNSGHSQTQASDQEDEEEDEDTEEAGETEIVQTSTSTEVVTKNNNTQSSTSQVQWIKPTPVATPTTTATTTLMTLQQEVHPQVAASSFTSTTAASTIFTSATVANTRPTISLLPNVLAFRTHPVLATQSMQIHPSPSHPNPLANHFYSSVGNHNHSMSVTESMPPSRKMMRCHYCCIWFEDRALGLLHQSLHSADETDPFTCKKCMKRLGNRLEFTAHIVWHLDPTMEDSGTP